MLYDEWLPKVWSTIYMPEQAGKSLGLPVEIHEENLVMPFPVVQFVEPFAYSVDDVRRLALEPDREKPEQLERFLQKVGRLSSGEVLRGVENMILIENADGEGGLGCVAKMDYLWPKMRKTTYAPEDAEASGYRQFLITLQRFNLWTKNRSVRFAEQPVSRQVRRYNGWAPEYKEFIIMRKGEPLFTGGHAMRKMYPLFKRLHPVRSHWRQEHLRTLRNGEILVVPGRQIPAHIRGKHGDAVQAKDYRLITGR